MGNAVIAGSVALHCEELATDRNRLPFPPSSWEFWGSMSRYSQFSQSPIFHDEKFFSDIWTVSGYRFHLRSIPTLACDVRKCIYTK